MCFYSDNQKQRVTEALDQFLQKGDPFTGWEVHKSLKNLPEGPPVWSARETSTYVRERFNQGGLPGWASTQVVPSSGPVLYFKLTTSMKASKVAAEIRSKMAAP